MAYDKQFIAQSSLPNNTLATKTNDCFLFLLLAALVGLVHAVVVSWLFHTQPVKKITPKKLVEVVLLPPPKPKEESPKPEPKIIPKPKPKIEKPKPVKAAPVPKKTLPPAPIKQVKENKPVPHKSIEHKPVEKPIKPVVKPTIMPNKPPRTISKPVEHFQPQPVLTQKMPTTAPTLPVTSHNTVSKKPSIATGHYPVIPTTPAKTSQISAKKATTVSSGHSSGGVSSEVAVLSQVNPSYPMRAKSRNIEGWVRVQFTVTVSGAVTNAHVVDASPPGIFDSAALAAIQQSRFKPKMVNGKAVNATATRKFNFNLN